MAEYKSYKDLPLMPITTVGSEANRTGGWRTFRPCLDKSNCIKCYICWKFCPDVSIRIGSDEFPEFDMEHCKGCGICANECPQNKKLEREKSENRAIKMVLEE